jgi:3-phenylpropionate/trans-cinnamate dioxygenase ferredoxin subunit
MMRSTPSVSDAPIRGVALRGRGGDEVERLVEFWKHGSQFSLVTGEPLQLPAIKATPVYSVDVRSGDVVLTLP